MSRTSAYTRLSLIVIYLFSTFSAAFGQVNGSALVSALTGKTVVPTVELGYTGSVAHPLMVNGHPATFPVKTLVYPDGHESFRVESGILHADAAQYKTFNRGLEFRIGKVELKGDYLELKLPSVIEPKQSAVVKLMLGSGWQTTMTNEAVLKMADRFLSDPSQHSATVAAKAQPPASQNNTTDASPHQAPDNSATSEAAAKLISVISIGNIPIYSLTPSIQWIETLPANSRMCIESEPITFDGGKFLRLPFAGPKVYTPLPDHRQIFTPNPAGDPDCNKLAAGLANPQLGTAVAAEVRGDVKAAFLLFKARAEQGDTEAQLKLWEMYTLGKVPGRTFRNMADELEGQKEGEEWLRKAADGGNARAQYSLGMGYLNSPQDFSEARKWFLKAADQGNADAQYQLGSMYENGKGVPKDSAEAMKWYHKAADQGNVNATGVIAQAEVRKEAEQGNAKAQYQLGMVYINGKGPGTPPDYVEAMKWFRKAADQGNPDAQFQLGSMCENGSGVPKDYAEAMKWYRKAAVQGNTDAQKYLKSHSEQNAKSTVADVPDPTLPDPKAAREAFSFLERQLTISQDIAGDPEPGLASIQSIKGALCHLRCGFHLAVGFGDGGVQDTEIEFALSDININPDAILARIDGIGRAIISFGTSDGSPRFARRDREMDMKQNVLSGWSDWEGTDKGFCRAKSDRDSLQRAVNALRYLAESCGAKESPF
jgi:TPR repeat protein